MLMGTVNFTPADVAGRRHAGRKLQFDLVPAKDAFAQAAQAAACERQIQDLRFTATFGRRIFDCGRRFVALCAPSFHSSNPPKFSVLHSKMSIFVL